MRMLVVMLLVPVLVAGEEPPADRFDRTGPQPGQWLPDVPLTRLDGQAAFLREEIRGTTLLVTSSFTCPKSRSRYESLAALAGRFQDHLRVLLIYVVEAHPIVDVCPYKDMVDVTAENRRDGILYRQPTTLEERLSLARAFREHQRIGLPILVDRMENRAWTALGAAPNLALLVDRDGRIRLRQGWYDGAVLEGRLREILGGPAGDAGRETPRDQERRDQQVDAALEDLDSSPAHLFAMGDPQGLALLERLPALAGYRVTGLKGAPDRWLIQIAAEGGHLAHVEALLAAGADPAAQTISPPALHLAAAQGHVAVVRRLLGAGVAPDLRSWQGTTAGDEAAFHGRDEVVALLLRAGATTTPFMLAAGGEIAAMTQFLRDDPSRAFLTDGRRRTLTTYAIRNRDPGMVALLARRGDPGLNPHATHESPVLLAARRGDVGATQELLQAGAAVDVNVYGSGTPLHVAVRHRHLPVATVLLEAGADPDLYDDRGETPLHAAVRERDRGLVAALLDHGADPRLGNHLPDVPCGPEGEHSPLDTALHLATRFHDRALMKLLIDHPRGGVGMRNLQDETPAHALFPAGGPLPPDHERLDVLQLLVAAGIDLAVEDRAGHTVLDRAVAGGDGPAVRYLRALMAPAGSGKARPVPEATEER